jgi:hypothetical protein
VKLLLSFMLDNYKCIQGFKLQKLLLKNTDSKGFIDS